MSAQVVFEEINEAASRVVPDGEKGTEGRKQEANFSVLPTYDPFARLPRSGQLNETRDWIYTGCCGGWRRFSEARTGFFSGLL